MSSVTFKSKNTRRMELKFGAATILYKYSDLTKFDKNLEGSRVIFEMERPSGKKQVSTYLAAGFSESWTLMLVLEQAR